MNAFRTSLFRVFAAGLLAASPIVLAAACSNDDVKIGTDGQPIACSSNADCPGGDVCTGGVCAVCHPSPEICDGIDNDCNGVVDEAAFCPGGGSCVNGACIGGSGTGGNGAGGSGTGGAGGSAPCASDNDCAPLESCINGVCTPNGCVPSAEVCNGIDDDCDGVVDNGATCPGGGSCVNGACTGGCLPSAEVCNGIDDDCNGLVDDGATCPGGGSRTNGVCIPAGCSPEVCDGIDNDCNGQVDDGNPGGGMPCNTGLIGACAMGTTKCTNGIIVCAHTTLPSAEVCDGIDNDCDGVVDQAAFCPAGACSNGACPCASDSDCPNAQTCVNGKCKP